MKETWGETISEYRGSFKRIFDVAKKHRQLKMRSMLIQHKVRKLTEEKKRLLKEKEE